MVLLFAAIFYVGPSLCTVYERELERLNRKITKTTTSAKVTFANLLNAFKARSAKTKAGEEKIEL